MAKTAKQLAKTSASIGAAFQKTDARVLPHLAECVDHWKDNGNWTPLRDFIVNDVPFEYRRDALTCVGQMVSGVKWDKDALRFERTGKSKAPTFSVSAIDAYKAGANGCTFREVAEAVRKERAAKTSNAKTVKADAKAALRTAAKRAREEGMTEADFLRYAREVYQQAGGVIAH